MDYALGGTAADKLIHDFHSEYGTKSSINFTYSSVALLQLLGNVRAQLYVNVFLARQLHVVK